jgi:hypothetical protein
MVEVESEKGAGAVAIVDWRGVLEESRLEAEARRGRGLAGWGYSGESEADSSDGGESEVRVALETPTIH